MTLLDHFRRRPRWESEDPAVRAEAVREIPPAEQDVLFRLVRQDADPRVRRAALKRIGAVAVLAEAARGDGEPSVREEALARLAEIAHGHDEAPAREAVTAIEDARHLASVVRASGSAGVRLLALSRIYDERTLATLAKTSDDPAVRREALPRVDDPSLLADVATKSEHKDVSTAAVERVSDLGMLETIAMRARNGGASRKAKARLEQLRPQPLPVEPPLAPTQLDPPVEPAASPEALPPAAVESPVPVETAAPGEPAGDVASSPERPAQAPAPVADDAHARAAARQAHEKLQKERLGRSEALLARLESLSKAEALTLRAADAALREAREARADLDHVPARLAQKIKAARAALFAKTQPLREAEDWTRWSNAAIQEQLCERIEALVPRSDLDKVAHEFHDCDARWAEARHAPKEEGELLRLRYQAARSSVKAGLDAHFAKKAESERANLQQKEALCVQAEALADSTEWVKAALELQALQARWKQLGPAPHKVSERIWKRFRGACDRFFTRRQDDLKHRKEEWGANLAKKQALCVRAEALAASSEWEAAAAALRKLQSEWKSVGPLKKSKSDEIWQRFRKACDAFFERYKHRDAIAAQERREEREALCAELEGLLSLAPEAAAPEGLADKVLALQAKARHAPGLAPGDEQAFGQRFAESRTRLVAAWPEAFRGTELDPETARLRKEKLLSRVEALAAKLEEARDEGPLTGEDLARRLKEALATNTMGGAAEAEARRRAEAEEFDAAHAAWKRLGPVPGDAGASLEERFEKACARFEAGRPRPARRGQSRVGAGIG
jgi:hypothetical protein